MPCDGKNPNCDRRRNLLAQLKCLISSMDRKKPCEWDDLSCPPVICYPTEISFHNLPYCKFVKPCKYFDFRASIMYKCECIKRNGLQDRCLMWDCMGRPECMTKLYPICEPGHAALLRLTDFGDVETALRKFYCTDQARETALTAYCRLVCDKARQRQTLPCNKNNFENVETFYTAKSDMSNAINYNLDDNDKLGYFNNFSSLYQFCEPPLPYGL
ncbi:uncharacterized protein LOC105828543 [Monomorium pharaonis]|uniref:uncharacterized protein LOC105828543 n=1 Tax=Monomorium pharaonis TaxID=307658 RepID=UPI00063F991F|nr:uncharacterized protein LOC105828543 [Monomorium pharaonis]